MTTESSVTPGATSRSAPPPSSTSPAPVQAVAARTRARPAAAIPRKPCRSLLFCGTVSLLCVGGGGASGSGDSTAPYAGAQGLEGALHTQRPEAQDEDQHDAEEDEGQV